MNHSCQPCTIVPSISVIIPTFMRDEPLVNSIESVLSQDFKQFELIVVDQTPTPGPKLANLLDANKDARLRYFHIAPPSLPAARNFGLAKARAEIIVFIDDDVALFPGFLTAYAEAYKDESISAVAGRIIQEGKITIETVTQIDEVVTVSGYFDCLRDQDCSTMEGCNMSFRAKALQSVGYFDTRYYDNAILEESDICARLVKSGHRLVFRRAAALHHYQLSRGGCRTKFRNYWRSAAYYHNCTLFFLKNRNKLLFGLFFLKLFQHHVLYGKFLIGWSSPLYFCMLLLGISKGFWSYKFGKQFSAEELSSGNCFIKAEAAAFTSSTSI